MLSRKNNREGKVAAITKRDREQRRGDTMERRLGEEDESMMILEEKEGMGNGTNNTK